MGVKGVRRSPVQKLSARVKYGSDNDCWEFLGARDKDGYGMIGGYKNDRPTSFRAHRVSYEHYVGPIADNLQIDHICHDPAFCKGGRSCPHRRCVNPKHLKLATHLENHARGRKSLNGGPGNLAMHEKCLKRTHCKWGHAFTPENTAFRDGGKKCKRCDCNSSLARYWKKKNGKETPTNS